MTEFDEVSRAIGELQGEVKGVKEGQARLEGKMDKIAETLTNHRLKTVGIASGISLLANIKHFKTWLFG